ncbi:cysteamine dioxygenase [Ranunculus cassubicifolius]
MRIEANVVEQKKQKNCELQRENKSIRLKKNRKRSKKSMAGVSISVVERLFLTCQEVFANCEAGTIPPPDDVERLRDILDTLKPADVGLSPDMPHFRTIETDGAPPITYLHIYESAKFSMGIFCLPPSGVIPLHNHPGMTVFSKILFGSMHIKSYDWGGLPASASENACASCDKPPGVRLANVKVDSTFTAPCNTSILYPADGGNMHCFKALTACAVLDVLGPPYCDDEGRHCTYYCDFPYNTYPCCPEVAEDERKGYVWLEEKEKPDEFKVVGTMYKGPKFVK